MIKSRPNVSREGRYFMSELSRILEVSRSTVYRWRQYGYLQCKKDPFNGRDYVKGKDIIKLFDVC